MLHMCLYELLWDHISSHVAFLNGLDVNWRNTFQSLEWACALTQRVPAPHLMWWVFSADTSSSRCPRVTTIPDRWVSLYLPLGSSWCGAPWCAGWGRRWAGGLPSRRRHCSWQTRKSRRLRRVSTSWWSLCRWTRSVLRPGGTVPKRKESN